MATVFSSNARGGVLHVTNGGNGTGVDEGMSAVVNAASPHHSETFGRARFGMESQRATAPLWESEIRPVGFAWGTNARPHEPIEIAAGDSTTS